MEKPNRKNIEDIFALTPMQEGMLFHYLKDGGSSQYFEQVCLDISGDIDIKLFEQAWNVVIDTNEMLRTAFRWKKIRKPVQVVFNTYTVKFKYYDFSNRDKSERKKFSDKIITIDRREKFDLSRVPFRVTLCKIDQFKYRMIISNHHILYDGWSNGIILQEFFAVYINLVNKKKPEKTAKGKFKEFVQWLNKQDKKEQEKFWGEYLRDFSEPTVLLAKGKEGKEINTPGNFHITLKQDIRERLERFIHLYKVTLAALLYSAWGILLQKYNNIDDVVFGTTISGRPAKIIGIEKIVGLFINTLPLRVWHYPGERTIDLLHRVQEDLETRGPYESTSLVKIKEYGQLGHNDVLFDSIVVIENYPLDIHLQEARVGQLSVDSYSTFEATNYDLILGITVSKDTAVNFEYNIQLYEPETIERLAHHFTTLLEEIIQNPREKRTELDILSTGEKKQLLLDFNGVRADFPKNKTLVQLFEEQVERTPDNISAAGEMQIAERKAQSIERNKERHAPCPKRCALTYKELNEKSAGLAFLLRERGVFPDTIAAIMAYRSVETIIGILGILKAGGAYLPIDPDYPGDRIKYMLTDSGTKILLSEDRHPVFPASQLPSFPASLSSSLAYVIYTSGSTGKPKGVLVEHHSVVNLALSQKNYFNINENDRILQFSSLCFDASVEQIFIALFSGAVLVLVDRNTLLDSSKFEEFISSRSINHLHAVPSFLSNVKMRDTFKLKRVISGGDVCPVALAKKWSKYCDFYNEYGPTETTVTSIEMKVECEEVDESLSRLPVGRPLGNTTIYLIDKWMKLVPLEVVGELHIGGEGVARGYLNRPELTAEKFDHDLWDYQDYHEKNKKVPGKKNYMSYTSQMYYVYKTGDLARWLPEGNIEFLGRIDRQVKIRGFRIELEEIESQILTYKGIKDAVVLARGDKSGDKYLCAYIVRDYSEPGQDFDNQELKEYLFKLLPEYMVPVYFIRIDKLPLTPTGKTDRRALPAPGIGRSEKYIAPRDEVERRLAEIYEEVLLLPVPCSIDANFFQLGGHSLRAVSLLAKIHKAFNVDLPLSEMFKRPSIRRLSQYIRDAIEEQYISIEAAEKKEYYALSSAQKRLYFLQQIDESGTAYNMTSAWVLKGSLDKNRLENTFRALIQRHESLRTSFKMIENEPVQWVHDKTVTGHWSLVIAEAARKEIGDTIKSFVKPFDLSQAPLLRVGLIKLLHTPTAPRGHPSQEGTSERSCILMVDMHHIISDGISSGVLVRNFAALYPGDGLPGMRIQYKDYARWQNCEKESIRVQEQALYWNKGFKADIPVLDLPTDYVRPTIQRFEGSSLSFEIGRETTEPLKVLALEGGATLYMVLLTFYTIFLSKISNQEDIVIGAPVAGRRHADLGKIVGMFVNTLALRNSPAGEKTFTRFLAEVKEKTLQAFENQEYQYEDLVEQVVVNRDVSRNPLFDVDFLFQNMEVSELTIPGLKFTPYEYETFTSKFDLTLESRETGENLLFRFEYSTKLFKPETIERFAGYFKKIVLEVLGNPHKKISRIEFLFEGEKRRILYDFNDTALPYPKDQTIHQLFENQVEQKPHHTALLGKFPNPKSQIPNKDVPFRQLNDGGNFSITYKELNKKSNQLARILRKQGIKTNTAVGIMMERSVEMLVGILAVLKAGGVYLPIDPEYPGKRIVSMLTSSGAPILFTQREILKGKSLLLNDQQQPLQIIPGDELTVQLQEEPGKNLDLMAGSNDLIYIIFTSGSTGTPKGAGVYHRGFMNLMHWFVTDFGLRDSDTNLLLTSFSFDLTQKNLYASLLTGGTLCIPGLNYFDPGAILEEIKDNHITWINCTPSMFYMMVEYEEAGEEKKLSSLRYVFLGGEPISVPKLIGWLESGGCHAEIVNTYGPTECTDICAYYRIREPRRFLEENVPVGKPVYNAQLFVLNNDLQPLPIGIAGELAIGGDGVGNGYVNDEALTSQKFLRLLFSHNEPKRLLYLTGDRVKWRADGNIEFLGRMDYQVKVRGYRIEMGEIESRLSASESVAEAVVLAQEDTIGTSYLCAYIVPANGKEFEEEKLKKELSQTLPGYMLPSFFVVLDEIPLTPNGKVDRLALPAPLVKGGSDFIPPRDRVEETLVIIWSQLLGIDRNYIGIDDNFFALGGHSLKAVHLVGSIHKELDVKIPLVQLFAAPTIRSVALLVHETKKSHLESIESTEKKDYYRLSSAQNRLYILQQMTPTSTGYNIPLGVILEGAVEKEKLANTFNQLIKRHESLRTCFEMAAGEPAQRIHEQVEFEIEYYDLATEDRGQRIEDKDTYPVSAIRHLSSEFIRSFDLSCAPLLRVGLMEQEEEKYLLIVDMHHIISDAMTLDIFTRDFMALYAGKGLPGLRIYYKDYSQWQNKGKNRKKITDQENFWTREFKGEIPVLDLPLDYNRPAVQSFEGKHLNFQLEEEQTRTLKKLAMEENATIFMVLVAIFNILLVKISGQEDIVVGTPVAGRRHAQLEQIMGIFINTLALRNYPSGEKCFTGFLKEVRERTLTALENQDYQFEDLVEKVVVKRELSRNPLFDVMFVLQNAGISKIEIPGLKLRYCEYETGISKFDLTFNCEEAEGRLIFRVEFSTQLFLEHTIQRFINYFKKIVSGVLDNKVKGIWEIEILSEKERRQLLYDFNDTAARYPEDQTIHQLFETQVERTPNHTALVGKIEKEKRFAPGGAVRCAITYRELHEKSNQLAYLFKEKGVKTETIVGIIGERSIDMIVSILGILKARGAYLPIDIDYPGERINYILADSNTNVLVTTSTLAREVKKLRSLEVKKSFEVIFIDSIEFSNFSSTHLLNFSTSHSFNLAYVIYTSGTTGRPKGVTIQHRNLVRLFFNSKNPFDFNSRDIWTMFHSHCFDFSVWEMYGSLLYGGMLIVITGEVARDTWQYLDILKAWQVTVLNQTPSAFYRLMNQECLSHQCDLSLRYVIFGGEALSPGRLKPWKQRYPNTRLINMFGITETTVHVTFKEITDEEIDQNKSNIGRPIPTLTNYILDNHFQPVPIGVTGELWVGGAGVARGYLNRPVLTAERFIENPHKPGQRLYRTGDLARILPDGEMVYLGRKDLQVQLRGFRIEPGEIENQLLRSELVKEAVVTAREDKAGDKYLCAYIVPSDANPFDSSKPMTDRLKNHLLRLLPDYMVPSFFFLMDKIPLTPNGKVNRQALPEPTLAGGGEYATPHDKLEQTLAVIWAEVLGIEKDAIGIDADFFELGGHSLKATSLISKLHKEFKVKVPLVEIFKTPNIRGLAERIKEMKTEQYTSIRSGEIKEFYPASYSQKRLWLLNQNRAGTSTFNMAGIITLEHNIDTHLVRKALNRIIQRHNSFRIGLQVIENQLVQVIKEAIEIPLKMVDLSSLEPSRKENKRQEIYFQELAAPFDLKIMPLFRTALLKLAEEKYELLFNMHHIISDGWSIEILKQEFNTLYHAYKKGIVYEMKPLRLQYKDYAAWQNRLLGDEEKMARAKEFWKNQLLGTLPVLNLPYDFSRPADSKESAAYRRVIPEGLTLGLRKMAIEHRASLFMVLLAAFNIFLSKITSQEEIIIAIPAAARQHEELKNIVGLFVNTLIIRTNVNPGENFADFFKRFRENTFKILEYQDIPLELICGQLKIKYPTIPVFFNMTNTGTGNLEKLTNLEDFHMEKVQDAKFDIVCYVNECQNGIEINCHYFKNRFKPLSIEKLMNLYEKILDNISAEPAKKIEEYTLTGKERTLKRKSPAAAATVKLLKKK